MVKPVLTTKAHARHVVSIQMLRAIAATMVVFVHIDTELSRLGYAKLGSAWLATGVDIFFVISGFIMWTSVERRPDITGAQFLKNRIIRIVPLYWLMTSFVLFVGLLKPSLLTTTQLRASHVISSYLFVPSRHPTTGLFWPLLIPGWSLNYEMVFYVAFAIALGVSAGRNLRFVLIAGLLFGIFLAGRVFEERADAMRFYANPIMFEFLLGVLLGLIWSTHRVQPSRAFLPLIPAGFLVLWLASHTNFWFAASGLGAALIVSGAVFLPAIPANPLSRLGDASYSLYLTHTIVLAGVATLCERLSTRPAPLLFISLSLACAFLAAFFMYSCFELPVTALLKRQFSGGWAKHRLSALKKVQPFQQS